MCVCVGGGGYGEYMGDGGGGVWLHTVVLYIHVHEKKRIFKVQKVQHSLSSFF